MAGWLAIHVHVAEGREDETAGLLASCSLGAEILGGEIVVYTEPGGSDRVIDALRSLGFAEDDWQVEGIPDGRWVERYQQGLRPFSIGEKFLVVPGSGDRERDTGRTPIVLVPGRAFGTGEHETTRLCVGALEHEVAAGQRWLDLGTGSGILAIVAARLGASVLAIDNDPEAVEVACAVVRENGMEGSVSVMTGSVGDTPTAAFDGVVANIVSTFFVAHAREMSARLRPGGVLVVSGILSDDLAAVEAAFEEAGVTVDRRDADGPWVALVLRGMRR